MFWIVIYQRWQKIGEKRNWRANYVVHYHYYSGKDILSKIIPFHTHAWLDLYTAYWLWNSLLCSFITTLLSSNCGFTYHVIQCKYVLVQNMYHKYLQNIKYSDLSFKKFEALYGIDSNILWNYLVYKFRNTSWWYRCWTLQNRPGEKFYHFVSCKMFSGSFLRLNMASEHTDKRNLKYCL